MGTLIRRIACCSSRFLAVSLAVSAVWLSAPSLVPAEEPDLGVDLLEEGPRDRHLPRDSAKLAALIATLEERARLVRTLITQASRSYRDAAMRRAEAERRLVAAEEALDRDLVRPKELFVERLDELIQSVREARAVASLGRELCDRRIDELWSLVHERDALVSRLAELRGALPSGQEPLTGVWELTWMPGNIAGTLYLDQSGTLVTGQYKLSNGMSGSLQGTYVNSKLYLQRIDAVRGRDAEIEGSLDAEGMRLKGTWQNFELVQGGLPRGQWMARRAP